MSAPLHFNTPTYLSHEWSRKQNKKIYYKIEAYQPSGSFKIRGMGALCQQAKEQGAQHLVCSSGGNAGYAVAYAGQQLSLPVTIVVPESTSTYMKDKIRAIGAKVEVEGKVWDEAHRYALDLSKDLGATYIHPFEHPSIWTGHSSMIEEVAEVIAEPDAIVVSVGGGGLLCGVLEGLERIGWTQSKIIAAETHGAASCAAALEKDALVTLDQINTIASSLGAKRITNRLLEWSRVRKIDSYLMSDAATMQACQVFANEYNILVEPACGAALSAVYHGCEHLQDAETILVIVCGGASVGIDKFQELMKKTN
ncbi:MAG: pyridoxal-phosphate dependent enzyme [Saprospiraceae bacterium]|nr:pyridoxal-phosphate dependent enzyme [Saprospiraceae bacterium]